MTKEKIIDTQFLVVVNGPSCAGKSAVADVLVQKYGGIFHAKADVVKWLISDYDPPTHWGIVHRLMLALMQSALAEGLSVVKEGGSYEPEKYVALAGSAQVPLYIVNVDAPWEVLTTRFEKRIEAKREGARVANADPARFKQLYDRYHAVKVDTPLSFDSSTQTPEEIASAIVAYMRKRTISK